MTYNVTRDVHDLPAEALAKAGRDGVPCDRESEFDTPATIEQIADALRAAGHTVHLVEAAAEWPRWFLTHEVDLVFNIAEGLHGEHRESQVPAVLESLHIPFTGSGSVTLALALDKTKTKLILEAEGISTPRWQLFPTPATPLRRALQFPLIVKPNREGSAKGIWRDSVVHDEASLRRRVAAVIERYHQEVLVEEFIDGTELTVGVLGGEALPVLEIDFASCRDSGEFFYSWRMKEFQGNTALGLAPELHCPARLDEVTTRRVQELTLRAHRALGCRDLSRTDVRLRADGSPFVLEVNPLPGLSPTDSNFPVMAAAAGLSHASLIQRIVALAAARDHRNRFSRPSGLQPEAANAPAAATPLRNGRASFEPRGSQD
ncbi:MAG: D-alanine--D-alanine ligase [Candidatus Omnitrophica bacterium]|nr:D-alanine--D-alanine ligase [Candidatus Omnitrophota bacterium]